MGVSETARRSATYAGEGEGLNFDLQAYDPHRYEQELELPSLPEMVFPDSRLKLTHQSGAALEFLALDALKRVNPSEDPLKVAVAHEWRKQR